MGAGGTWRAVFHKHVLIALTGVEAEISASNSDERGRQQRHHFLSHIGVSQIEAHSADVDDCEIEREIFFAKKSRVRLAGGF